MKCSCARRRRKERRTRIGRANAKKKTKKEKQELLPEKTSIILSIVLFLFVSRSLSNSVRMTVKIHVLCVLCVFIYSPRQMPLQNLSSSRLLSLQFSLLRSGRRQSILLLLFLSIYRRSSRRWVSASICSKNKNRLIMSR